MSAKEDLTINASPTKEFFISMLTRDIKLIRSIIDLIDNSCDGARRLNPGANFENLWVRLETNGGEFKISDNCGGIPHDLAKNYAFRFGRPKGMPQTDHSVGQFGVGMKRALFKLGERFTVESTSPDCHFTVEHNVDEWLAESGNEWQFRFKDVKHYERKKAADKCGTTIAVTQLHESVKGDFESEIFETQLKEAIRSAHQLTIQQGLAISLNGISLTAEMSKLLQSAELKPAYKELELDKDSGKPIAVKIYAGVAGSDPHESGWNIFCNGRLVLEADGGFVTGWGDGVPRYHNQYARFRGFVFFDCDDASKLPWNTTKTGVDSDSRIYQSVRQKMIEIMRPVIDFLNRLDKEKDQDKGDLTCTTAVEKAKHRKLEDISPSARFVSPPSTPKKKSTEPLTRKIQYFKPEAEIDEAKRALGVTSLKEVGERTFEYFYEMECE